MRINVLLEVLVEIEVPDGSDATDAADAFVCEMDYSIVSNPEVAEILSTEVREYTFKEM